MIPCFPSIIIKIVLKAMEYFMPVGSVHRYQFSEGKRVDVEYYKFNLIVFSAVTAAYGRTVHEYFYDRGWFSHKIVYQVSLSITFDNTIIT